MYQLNCLLLYAFSQIKVLKNVFSIYLYSLFADFNIHSKIVSEIIFSFNQYILILENMISLSFIASFICKIWKYNFELKRLIRVGIIVDCQYSVLLYIGTIKFFYPLYLFKCTFNSLDNTSKPILIQIISMTLHFVLLSSIY